MADEEEAPPTPVWEGAFDEDGLPHGQGTMRYPPPPVNEEEDEEEKPGDLFVGNMDHGKRQGQGKYTWSTGAVYEGAYVGNKKHGLGKLTFPDKGVFEGEFVEDAIDGTGTYVYSNGDMYHGAFKQGKRHGNGMYHFKAVGCQMVGEWSEGGFMYGRWVYKDGSMFYGSFNKLQPSEGAYYFSNSQLLQRGSFKEGTWLGDPVMVGKVDGLVQLVAPPAVAAGGE